MIRNIIKFIFKTLFMFFTLNKLNNKKIVFIEGTREKMSGNCGAVFKKLQNYKEYSFILVEFYKSNVKYPNLKHYSFFDLRGLFHIATAKYLIANEGFFNFLPKRYSQLNIQLWHGAGAFKKFGYSIELEKKDYHMKKNKVIDILSVSSDKVIDVYTEAFQIDKLKVKNLGMPRADIFFKEDEKLKVKERFFNEYPKLKNKKIIMYAPTFRDNDKGDFKLKLDIELMKEKLEKLGYVLFLRLHPNIKKDNISVDNIFSYDFSKYEQVSDLLIVSDILISDYSSIIFEFSIMKKPILFYSYDVEEYIKDRGFYYNYYEFIPNKINYTTEEVINSIINKEWDLERIEKFARYFFNPFDGNSTERVLKEVGLWEEEK